MRVWFGGCCVGLLEIRQTPLWLGVRFFEPANRKWYSEHVVVIVLGEKVNFCSICTQHGWAD